jgi:hypothetical protein
VPETLFAASRASFLQPRSRLAARFSQPLAELLVGNVGVIFTTVRCRRCSCFA